MLIARRREGEEKGRRIFLRLHRARPKHVDQRDRDRGVVRLATLRQQLEQPLCLCPTLFTLARSENIDERRDRAVLHDARRRGHVCERERVQGMHGAYLMSEAIRGHRGQSERERVQGMHGAYLYLSRRRRL